jgi:hypothetical protein
VFLVLQAQLSLGTARGASALPRLTLRRVRSVGRWNHNGDPAAAATGGPATAAAAGVSDDDLSPAAQMILKAGALELLLFIMFGKHTPHAYGECLR